MASGRCNRQVYLLRFLRTSASVAASRRVSSGWKRVEHDDWSCTLSPDRCGSLLFLVPIYFVSLKPARRLAEYFRWQSNGWRRPEALASVAVGGVAVTMFLFT